jgi:4-hydroxyphenylpyruvate dioxygenase
MVDLFENPLGTNGFAFIEYAGKEEKLGKLFEQLGFTKVANHKSRAIYLYRQGNINFLLNAEDYGQPKEFSDIHIAGASSMAFVVKDADAAFVEALKRGAVSAMDKSGAKQKDLPTIDGIGGSLIHLLDDESFYDNNFDFITDDRRPIGAGLTYIDHLTHNVFRGNMDVWGKFYEDIFNFREIRYFDIEGKLTGLKSRAMTSPCGKIRIPLNESSDDKSQIEEFLKRFNGEGIQHIALGTADIYETVRTLNTNQVPLQQTPATYYEKLDARVQGHGEDTVELQKLDILLDGAPTEDQGILLQIFTKDAIGPVFFEIIQRKGNEGFGEGNFQALFESIELDQIRRGVLEEKKA